VFGISSASLSARMYYKLRKLKKKKRKKTITRIRQRLFIGETQEDSKKRKGITNILLCLLSTLFVFESVCLEKTEQSKTYDGFEHLRVRIK
jgi:hypothetical protein